MLGNLVAPVMKCTSNQQHRNFQATWLNQTTIKQCSGNSATESLHRCRWVQGIRKPHSSAISIMSRILVLFAVASSTNVSTFVNFHTDSHAAHHQLHPLSRLPIGPLTGLTVDKYRPLSLPSPSFSIIHLTSTVPFLTHLHRPFPPRCLPPLGLTKNKQQQCISPA